MAKRPVYREGGDDEVTKEQAKTIEQGLQPDTEEQETQEQEDVRIQGAQGLSDLESTPLETAVLLVLTKKGTVHALAQLENLELKRYATHSDIYRICSDVINQMTSVRIVGEVLRGVNHIVSEGIDRLARVILTSGRKHPNPRDRR